jgi:hypothetical protein
MDSGEIARVRAIPLALVLERLGAERDPKDPARNWRLGASRITVSESRFFDHNQAGALHRMRETKAGGGGAIDLVQYLKDVSFPDAVRELGSLVASRPHVAAATPLKSRNTSVSARADTRPSPRPAPDRLARAHWYLTQVRAIPEAVVNAALQNGNVFADTKGNVVFRLSDETGREVGFEVRGTYDKPYHSVHGEKGLFITKADRALTAAFVESGVEALSYQAVRGSGLVVSTTGSAIERPARMAGALKERGYEIIAAFNADKAGDRLAERLSAHLAGAVRRDRPDERLGKDWNELLQRQPARRGGDASDVSGRSLPSPLGSPSEPWVNTAREATAITR